MIKKPTRILAIDYGMARIGVAYSDERKIIVSPLEVVKAEKKSAQTLQKLLGIIQDHQKKLGYDIEKIIIGMPFLMTGKTGLMADEVNSFIGFLREALPDVDIIPWDERLSSVQAEKMMREANMTRKNRAKHVDTVSAMIILQNYLENLENIRDNL